MISSEDAVLNALRHSGISIRDMRFAAGWIGEVSRPNLTKVYRLIKGLQRSGLVAIRGGKWCLTKQGDEALAKTTFGSPNPK
jgi:hypothetical protein